MKVSMLIFGYRLRFNNYYVFAGFIPYDGSPREELVTIFVPITVAFSFLNICGIACAIVCLLFNIVFQNRKYYIL